jgi:hypothetical protein
MDFGFEGVGDRQSFQNIIITILNHEHFSHGTSTFNRNSVNGKNSQCESLSYKSYWLENVKIDVYKLIAEPRAIGIVFE